MEQERKSYVGVLSLILFSIIFGFFMFAGSMGNSGKSGTSSPSVATDLNATVQHSSNGIYITNNETGMWKNCMVGVNGGAGWGFDDPPYKTPYNLTFYPNKTSVIPFTQIIASDGTRFDYATHAITRTVIICNPTGGMLERYSIYGG